MSALRGAFSVMVRDFLFHEIVGGTDPGGITAWYALSGLIGGKILRACKCGAIPFCAVMLGGFFYGILYVCSCIREQHWIALEGENLTILILCTAGALLGSVQWKKK